MPCLVLGMDQRYTSQSIGQGSDGRDELRRAWGPRRTAYCRRDANDGARGRRRGSAADSAASASVVYVYIVSSYGSNRCSQHVHLLLPYKPRHCWFIDSTEKS